MSGERKYTTNESGRPATVVFAGEVILDRGRVKKGAFPLDSGYSVFTRFNGDGSDFKLGVVHLGKEEYLEPLYPQKSAVRIMYEDAKQAIAKFIGGK